MSVRFHEATALTRTDAEALQEAVRRRVLFWCVGRELLEMHVADEMLAWDHAWGFSLDASVPIAAPRPPAPLPRSAAPQLASLSSRARSG